MSRSKPKFALKWLKMTLKKLTRNSETTLFPKNTNSEFGKRLQRLKRILDSAKEL